MKLVVSVNVLLNYISDLLFIVSCLLQFLSLCGFFSIVHEHSLAGVLPRVSNAFNFKIAHRHKTINKK